jgi:hypothetical protein
VETGEASVAKRVVPRAPAEECHELIPKYHASHLDLHPHQLRDDALRRPDEDLKESWPVLIGHPSGDTSMREISRIFDGSLGFVHMLSEV